MRNLKFLFSICLAILFISVIQAQNDIVYLRDRQQILDFIEQLRKAYNQKDIDFIDKVFFQNDVSDTYKQAKREYVNFLYKIFAQNDRINVLFNDIEIISNSKDNEIYRVSLKQSWNTSNYNDVSYLFLNIKLNDNNPKILECVRQSEMPNDRGIEDKILVVSPVNIPNVVKLTVTDVLSVSVQHKMEATASELLTELNRVYESGNSPSLNKIKGIDKAAVSSILSIWENMPFQCTKKTINVQGWKNSYGGWQIRNIPIFLKNEKNEDAYRILVINFDNSGNIDDIYLGLEMNQYINIMGNGNLPVVDLRRRQQILDFVEKFRNAYNRKDIELLAKIYSDDALIVTGKIVKQSKAIEGLEQYGFSKEKIEYQVKTKKEYIDALRNVFRNNTRINIVFDDIEVTQHPKHDEMYCVILKQGWSSTNYSDVGWLFLMIDYFKGGEDMKVNVRVWSPLEASEEERDFCGTYSKNLIPSK